MTGVQSKANTSHTNFTSLNFRPQYSIKNHSHNTVHHNISNIKSLLIIFYNFLQYNVSNLEMND